MRASASVSAVAMLAVAAISVAAASAGPSAARAAQALPKQCPSHSLVGKTLGLILRKRIVSYTSATYQGGGPSSFRAMPAGATPIHAMQKTCLYTYPNALEAANGIIVPVTITYEFPVTKANFSAARHAAGRSVDPITVRGLGDVAWVIKAPRGDPRGGNSLFVLTGTTEVVVGAPPKATVLLMTQLVRRIL
jgi:hypothetical protein